MRLRSRSRRPSEVAPGRPFASWTTVGNLDSTARGLVDPAGRVVVQDAGWSLDWWIGAEDRWHVPAREAAVRQQLVGSSPVVETRVRIPGGDAVSRAYGARGVRGDDLLVVEVHNDSKAPVALAIGVQAHDAGGRVGQIALQDSTVAVDGEPVLHLARAPGRFAMSRSADERSAIDVVLAGDAGPMRSAAVACDDGGAQAVLLFPLAHTATLRLVIALDGVARAIDPVELPSAAQVASGWATHARRGARIEVPDRRLRDAFNASSRFLRLAGGEDASLATIAAGWRLTGERPGLDALEIARLVPRFAKRGSPDDLDGSYLALPAIADLLGTMGEPRAADDVRAIHRAHTPSSTALADPYELLASASPTWTWATERSGHDLAVNAALVLAVRNLLVAELDDGLALSPTVPDAWLGLGWEVHDLPTALGLLSFAVRWHGERPALLWELAPPPDHGPVRLTMPALDASWSTTDARGEALLGPVPVPERPSQRRGLTIPVTIEPMRRPP